MRDLKERGEWAPTTTNSALAVRRGKWICGTRRLKESQAYPPLFGLVITMLHADVGVDEINDTLSTLVFRPAAPASFGVIQFNSYICFV